MIKHILTLVAILSIIGCSARPIRDVQYVEDDYILAARTKSVEVHAKRTHPFELNEGVWVDVWLLRLVNTHMKKDWCASIDWRQMDYAIRVPKAWFYLPPNSYMDIGAAVQETWTFIETELTFDDAAFSVYRLNLMKPIEGQCVAKSK